MAEPAFKEWIISLVEPSVLLGTSAYRMFFTVFFFLLFPFFYFTAQAVWWYLLGERDSP